MKIRKFTAGNTQEAIAKVKNELGGEALIINTKKVRQKGVFGYFKKPMFEVTAAIDEQAQVKAKRLAGNVREFYEKNPAANATGDVFAQFQTQLKTAGENDAAQYRRRPPAAAGPPAGPPVYAGSRTEAPVYADPRIKAPVYSGAGIEAPVKAGEQAEAPAGAGAPFFTDAPERQRPTLEAHIANIENILSKVYREVSVTTKLVEVENEKLAPLNKVLRLFYDNLVQNDVEPEFSLKIIEKVGERIYEGESARDAAAAFCEELAEELGSPEIIGAGLGKKPAVAIFVGPTGVGKTTTLAKIAADFALNKEMDVALITADTYRIAAVQQMKTYAEILGIPVSVAYSPGEIKDCVEAYSGKDLILIDTAGRSHKNKAQFEELRELVALSDADEVFLVLSLTASAKNNREIINNYSFLDGYKLIFTKADEAPAFGSILNARMLTGKRLSYITVGQSVPDDIEVADVGKIARNLIGGAQPFKNGRD